MGKIKNLKCNKCPAPIFIVCAAILGGGFAAFYRRGRLAVPGGFALLCASSTFHAIYNLMVAEGGAWRLAGHIMPLVALLAMLLFTFFIRKN